MSRILNVKYIGDIDGKFGIGTKRINTGTLSRRCLSTEHKDPLPDINNQKVIFFSNTDNKLNQLKLEDEFKKSKKLWYSTNGKLLKNKNKNIKVTDINLNSDFMNKVNFEINLLTNKHDYSPGKLNNADAHINANANARVNLTPRKLPINNINNNNLSNIPYILRNSLNKKRVLSGSEIMSNRYIKSRINLEDVLIHHNANVRKDINSEKIKDFQMKKSLKIDGKIYIRKRNQIGFTSNTNRSNLSNVIMNFKTLYKKI